MQTLGRRVLDMSHVEIETSAVEEKSSITRWFLVVSVMQIDRASVRLSKQIVFNLRRPQLRIDVRFVFTQKTAVFGFDSNDPIHRRQLMHRIAIWLEPISSMIGIPPWPEAFRSVRRARPSRPTNHRMRQHPAAAMESRRLSLCQNGEG